METQTLEGVATETENAPEMVKVLVEKRDGRVVDFDPINIISAVKSAFADLDKKIGPQEERLIRDIANQVEAEIKDRYNGPAKIEDIQNLVEHGLIEDHLYDVARTYTNYRLNKDIERAKATDINEAVKRLVNRDEALVRENANKDSNVYSTQRDLLAGAVSKASAFSMLPDAVSNAHMKGDIHFHDAATQITQIMKDVASSQYGGQTANRADEHFAEYAKKDYDKFLEQAHEIMPDDLPIEIAERQVRMAKAVEPKRLHFEKDRPALPMDEPFDKTSDRLQQLREIWAKIQTRKAIYDAMQTMEYQINSNRVSNGQTPFVTVGFGLGTDWFAREIQRAIFLNRIRGLGSEHHTAIFPKLVFTIKHGVNADPGDPNYDLKQLALECATKRMYPDVIFYENIVKITGSFKAPMGCRSFLQGWIDPKTGKDVEDGRMNLGVVTVNIPRIALESHGDKDRFWKIFDERMAVAHQALQFRIMRCKQATPVNAPTLFRFGAFGRLGANDSVDQLFRNERATVSLGYIGLYEATSVFYGKDWMRDHDWDPEGKEFALSIVKRMNDHDFYTNSFHYPVWLQPTPMEKLDYEKDFPYYASGGFINYCEFPCLQANPKALEAVWDYAYTIGIGYLGTNTPIDRCYECGFEGDFEPTEEGFKCPECGNSDPDRCNVTKRTCGYLGNPVQRPMVHGRHEEIAHRVKHMSGETGHVTLDDGSEREWFEEAK